LRIIREKDYKAKIMFGAEIYIIFRDIGQSIDDPVVTPLGLIDLQFKASVIRWFQSVLCMSERWQAPAGIMLKA
jgi:hypothetical protein